MVELIDNVLLVRELTGRSADAATRDRLENRILDLSQAEQAVESKFVKQQLDYLMRFPRTPNRDAP